MKASLFFALLHSRANDWVCRHPLGAWLAVGLLAVGLAGSAFFPRGLLETTEGRYALCAWEMLERENFLEPTLDGQPHWTKPPLTYWVLAAGMATVGAVEEGARMAQGAVFLALVGAVVLVALAVGDGLLAWWAALVTETGLLPLLGATFLSADLLLTLWETLAVGAYLMSLRSSSPRRWLDLMGLWWGLAFLTKGPPGLLPLLALVPWHLGTQRGRPLVTGLGVVLFGGVGLGWYAFEALRHPELLGYWLGEEVVARVASDSFHRHPEPWKPFVIYLPLLAATIAPWMLAARLTLRQVWLAVPAVWRVLFGLWLLLPLLVFFVVKSRLPLYVLPLAVPLALGMAWGLRQSSLSVRWVLIFGLGVAVGAGGGRFLLGQIPLTSNMRPLFAMARSLDPQQIVVVGEKELFGLQAYAKESGLALRRISVDDCAALQRPSVALRTSVVVRHKRAAAVLEALGFDSDDLRVQRWADWVVVHLSPEPLSFPNAGGEDGWLVSASFFVSESVSGGFVPPSPDLAPMAGASASKIGSLGWLCGPLS